MARHPKRSTIAAALGVSGSRISQLKRRGMPVHSAEAALAWYAEHVRPYLPTPAPPPSARPVGAEAWSFLAWWLEAPTGAPLVLEWARAENIDPPAAARVLQLAAVVLWFGWARWADAPNAPIPDCPWLSGDPETVAANAPPAAMDPAFAALAADEPQG